MFKTVLRRFARRKVSVLGAVILLFFLLVALFGPMFCTQDPLAQDLVHKYQQPSSEHWFGTDNLGRDTFTRMIYGARVSLSISFAGVMSGCLVGVLLGVCAGFFGGWVDTLVSRLIDILLAFPSLLLAITVVAILGSGTENTAIAIAIFSIPSIARMVRGIVMANKDAEYIQACRVMGASNARMIFTHIIPNAVSQIIVNITLNLGTAILTASSLSFLGLGVQPPAPEWGAMLSTGRDVIRAYPLAVLIPGIAITLVVMSFSLVGDGLRDALDPKLKNS
ncbi:MAG: ABC transporter permease [Candidatus Limiplasma sp.]|nr:ABC transporter permease [Clostridiales bacterium]MDY3817144.1 ABC transporter permease [Candidatus Limiplasma sp.]